MLVASVLSAEMRLESTRCVVPRTALPAPLQRVSATGLKCLVIASGERSCASVRKESVNVVVREAEGRGVICVMVDDAETFLCGPPRRLACLLARDETGTAGARW